MAGASSSSRRGAGAERCGQGIRILSVRSGGGLFLAPYQTDSRTESDEAVTARKGQLYDTIVEVLRRHRMLNYFQGYHDIVQVLLLVLGPKLAVLAVSHVSLLKIRDYMLPSMTPAIQHLNLIPAILLATDVELAAHLHTTRPFFALSATLTLYAHDIQEYSDIARLYDFILAHEPVMTIYLFSAIVLSRRKELLEIPLEEPEMLHFTLSKLPQPLNLQGLIQGALALFQEHPLESLGSRAWRQISSSSVLKTSRSIPPSQTLDDGEDLWYKQAGQLRRQEMLKKGTVYVKKNQRPIIALTATVLVGLYSIWLRKSGNDRLLLGMMVRSSEFFRTLFS